MPHRPHDSNPTAKYYKQLIIELKQDLMKSQAELQSLKLWLTALSPFVIGAIGYTLISIFRGEL